MTTIKQQDEFLKRIAEPTVEINNNIREIKDELVKLQADLDESDNQFTLEGAKRNKELTNDIKILKETLANAKKRKEEIIREHSQEVFTEARSILHNHKAEMNKKHEADKAEIVRMINEIRAINERLKAKDMEYTEDERNFIRSVRPFLADMKDEQSTGNRKQFDLLKNEAWQPAMGVRHGIVLDFVNEAKYEIKGLLNTR